MKIMIVAPYFYPKIGGMENYAYNISKGLKEKYGWKVVVITSNHEEKKYKVEIINGLKIYRLPAWFKMSNTPINPLWYFNIKKIIKEEKPDLINTHSPVPFIADITALVAGKTPFVATYHSGSMIKGIGTLDPLIYLYESLLLKLFFGRSTKIICVSPDYIKKNLERYKMKVKYISPGVDTKIFKPLKRRPINDVLYVGRIEKSSDWKGIKYLLDAISIVKSIRPNVSLRLVGLGDGVEDFKKYSVVLNISKNITFVRPKMGKEIVREFQKSKMLVLPSTTEAESFGIVLIEAMACKKPVIGSKIGGIPYVIDNKVNGLLVEPKNSKQLAKAIIKILKNPNLARYMGKNGYIKVTGFFQWDEKVKETNQVFQEIVQNNSIDINKVFL